MKKLDCHTHLSPPYFTTQEADQIIHEANQSGIKIILVTEEFEDFDKVIELAEINPHVVIPYVGIHPVQRNKSLSFQEYLQKEHLIIHLLTAKISKGIGEIGLDFSPHIIRDNQLQKQEQLHIFRRQVEIALEFNVFINVHSRQAGHHAINEIEKVGNSKVIMHAFDGKLKYVSGCLERNPDWFFSIPASVQRDEKMRQLAMYLPDNNILLESDAPALGPIKGVKATPLDIIDTLVFVAKLRNVDAQDLQNILTKNNSRVLGLDH
jgi:TatD DNase family protein